MRFEEKCQLRSKTRLIVIEKFIEWLDTHQSEEFSVYNDKQSEVESVIKPIITKLYENANPDATGGMPSGC